MFKNLRRREVGYPASLEAVEQATGHRRATAGKTAVHRCTHGDQSFGCPPACADPLPNFGANPDHKTRSRHIATRVGRCTRHRMAREAFRFPHG